MKMQQVEVMERMVRLGSAVKRAASAKRNGRRRVRRDAEITLEQLKEREGISPKAFAKRFVP